MFIVCVIIKRENLYIREFCEHYLSIGFSKIVIYDNNDNDGERPQDVLQHAKYYDSIEIIDFRGMSCCQHIAYNDCIERYHHNNGWILFVDCDEFLVFANKCVTNIQQYIDEYIANDTDCIKFNWKCFGDNGLTHYDGRPVKERFTTPFDKYFSFNSISLYNRYVKCIVRCCAYARFTHASSHTPTLYDTDIICRNSDNGIEDPTASFTDAIHWDNAYISHYVTKTIEEFIQHKYSRGYPDGNSFIMYSCDPVKLFFKYPNKITDDKIAVANDICNKSGVNF